MGLITIQDGARRFRRWPGDKPLPEGSKKIDPAEIPAKIAEARAAAPTGKPPRLGSDVDMRSPDRVAVDADAKPTNPKSQRATRTERG